jgi:ribose transport system ATP-binding protein
MAEPLFSMRRISKSFGATRALADVSFAVNAGEVRALIGENGAGKSTLLSLLAGVFAPDAGSMQVQGRDFAPRDPAQARRAGVAMIHQELAIAPDLSAAENISLGSEPARAGWIDRAADRERARAALARLANTNLDVDRKARELPLSAQQQVEIARALAADSRVIVFDEPTSSLSKAEAARLHVVIRELAAAGLAVVVVTHFLEELAAFADTFTVLRDGAVVLEGEMANTSGEDLVAAMAGRAIDVMFPKVEHQAGEVLLRIESLSGVRMPQAVSLELRRGEILGLAGLVGAGRSELLRCIFGLDPVRSGSVHIAGAPLPLGNPRESIARGLGFLSEDRKHEGLALNQSIEDNVSLSRLGAFARGGWLSLARRSEVVRKTLASVRCKAPDPAAAVATLSGGNQQKVAFARLLHQDADVYLLDEPTRGIDVAAKSEMYRSIGELAARGKAVLLSSSHLPELLHVADRIAVMRRGKLVAQKPAAMWTEAALLREAAAANVGATV